MFANAWVVSAFVMKPNYGVFKAIFGLALVSLERRKPFIALVKTMHFDLQTSLRAEGGGWKLVWRRRDQ